MNRSYRAIYVIAAVVVLTPVALRAVTWHKARPQAFEPSMAQAGEVLFKHDWTVNDPLCSEKSEIIFQYASSASSRGRVSAAL